jgi:hypothetical protein
VNVSELQPRCCFAPANKPTFFLIWPLSPWTGAVVGPQGEMVTDTVTVTGTEEGPEEGHRKACWARGHLKWVLLLLLCCCCLPLKAPACQATLCAVATACSQTCLLLMQERGERRYGGPGGDSGQLHFRMLVAAKKAGSVIGKVGTHCIRCLSHTAGLFTQSTAGPDA